MTTSDDAPCAPPAASSKPAKSAVRVKRILCMGGSDRGRRGAFLVVVAAPTQIRKGPLLNRSNVVTVTAAQGPGVAAAGGLDETTRLSRARELPCPARAETRR